MAGPRASPPGRAKKGERQVAIILLHDRKPGREPDH